MAVWLRGKTLAGGLAAFACAVAWWSAAPVGAQAPTGTRLIWTGVYTAEQAERGESTFMTRCAGCHRADLAGGQVGANFAPALGGTEFMQRWDSQSVERLYRIIRDTMPRGTPGILGEQTTLEVVSFILKFNGFPAGQGALTGDEAVLSKVVFVPKEGTVTTRELANFAPVEAVGCLTRASSFWTLTRATDMRPASPAGSPVPAEAAALGAETYRLVSPAAFGLPDRDGAKVRVKGIMRRDPDETLVNLTAVDTIADRCEG